MANRPAFTLSLLHEFLGSVFQRETWWEEFWSCVGTLVWGALFAISHTRLYLDVPSLRVVLDISSAEFWEFSSILFGCFQLVSLLINHKGLRWSASVLLSCLWGVLGAGVWAAQPWGPGAAPYGVLCWINLSSVLRLPFGR